MTLLVSFMSFAKFLMKVVGGSLVANSRICEPLNVETELLVSMRLSSISHLIQLLPVLLLGTLLQFDNVCAPPNPVREGVQACCTVLVPLQLLSPAPDLI